MEYVVLDIESTGLSKYRDKIIEIAAIKIKDGEIVDKYQTLINPKKQIPAFIVRLTGITNEMVMNSPTIDEILPHLMEFISDLPIVGHSVAFDYGFIDYNLRLHINKKLNNHKLCTRKLAYRLLPELASRKLSTICNYLNVVNENAHRAMADVMATQKVFIYFVQKMNQLGFKNRDDIITFESMKPLKCRELLSELD